MSRLVCSVLDVSMTLGVGGQKEAKMGGNPKDKTGEARGLSWHMRKRVEH